MIIFNCAFESVLFTSLLSQFGMDSNEMKVVAPTNENQPLTEQELVFEWKNVDFSVPGAEKGTSRPLLQLMQGFVKSGEFVAIMGGSGAGKSTLLNVLAGRVSNAGTLNGEITVNGTKRNEKSWRKLCAYVEQDDMYVISCFLLFH